jgi:hypothetical protein
VLAPALCGFVSLDAYVHATVHVLLLTVNTIIASLC